MGRELSPLLTELSQDVPSVPLPLSGFELLLHFVKVDLVISSVQMSQFPHMAYNISN